jgi:hypothetical protein
VILNLLLLTSLLLGISLIFSELYARQLRNRCQRAEDRAELYLKSWETCMDKFEAFVKSREHAE